MASSLNLSLTDELRAFVDQNSGDGTLYATPSEFVRDLLREKKNRQEAAYARDSILDTTRNLLRLFLAGEIRQLDLDRQSLR